MALYKIAEIARLTGKTPKYIHTIISRGKLIKNDKRQIDTAEPINLLWLEENQVIQESHKELTDLQKVNLEQKQLAIEKAKKEIAVKQMELEKLQGSLVNLEMATNIVKAYGDGLKRDLKTQTETLIQDICSRNGIDTALSGEYKLKALEIINKASKVAVLAVKEQFGSIKE